MVTFWVGQKTKASTMSVSGLGVNFKALSRLVSELDHADQNRFLGHWFDQPDGNDVRRDLTA